VFAIPAAKEYLRCRDQGGLVEKFHIDRHFHGTLPRYASEDLQRLASQGYAFHGDDVFYLFGWDFYPNVNSSHTYVNSQFGKSVEDMLTSVELQNYILKDVGAVIDLKTGLEIRATVYSEGDKIEVVEHLYRRELELWVKVTDEFTASVKNSDFIEMKAIADGFYPECYPVESTGEIVDEDWESWKREMEVWLEEHAEWKASFDSFLNNKY
jgi:hypothetical protein